MDIRPVGQTLAWALGVAAVLALGTVIEGSGSDDADLAGPAPSASTHHSVDAPTPGGVDADAPAVPRATDSAQVTAASIVIPAIVHVGAPIEQVATSVENAIENACGGPLCVSVVVDAPHGLCGYRYSNPEPSGETIALQRQTSIRLVGTKLCPPAGDATDTNTGPGAPAN